MDITALKNAVGDLKSLVDTVVHQIQAQPAPSGDVSQADVDTLLAEVQAMKDELSTAASSSSAAGSPPSSSSGSDTASTSSSSISSSPGDTPPAATSASGWTPPA